MKYILSATSKRYIAERQQRKHGKGKNTYQTCSSFKGMFNCEITRSMPLVRSNGSKTRKANARQLGHNFSDDGDKLHNNVGLLMLICNNATVILSYLN